MGQLSFFSADARPRALSDLEGVLCGRGQVVVFGRGTTARLSVVLGAVPPPLEDDPGPDPEDPAGSGDAEGGDGVDGADGGDGVDVAEQLSAPVVGPADVEFLDLDPDELAALLAPRESPVAAVEEVPVPVVVLDGRAEWRARALCCAFRTRGADAEVGRAPDGRPVVRTTFRADLVEMARRWTRGAVKAVPPDLDLDGPRLRLWVLASGRRVGRAYLLDLDPHAEWTHEPLLTASRRAGLGATLGGDRSGPVLRIVGQRRMRRLGELVGDPPADLVDDVWPE